MRSQGETIMVNEASQVILKLIDIEENVGKLYRIFGSVHPSDFEFWMQLANEDDHAHADRIKAYMTRRISQSR